MKKQVGVLQYQSYLRFNFNFKIQNLTALEWGENKTKKFKMLWPVRDPM